MKYKRGEVVLWRPEGEYVIVGCAVWDDDTELIKVVIPRCGEEETVAPIDLRKLTKRERGETKAA